MPVNNTISQKDLSAQSLFPEKLPSKVGSTLVLLYQKVFLKDQFPEAPSKVVSSVKIFPTRSFTERYTATITPSLIEKSPFPNPPPNKIGEEDLPGGLRLTNVITGKSSPMYDLSSGIVRIDNIAVFFDAKA